RCTCALFSSLLSHSRSSPHSIPLFCLKSGTIRSFYFSFSPILSFTALFRLFFFSLPLLPALLSSPLFFSFSFPPVSVPQQLILLRRTRVSWRRALSKCLSGGEWPSPTSRRSSPTTFGPPVRPPTPSSLLLSFPPLLSSLSLSHSHS